MIPYGRQEINDFPVAEKFHQEAISIPKHAMLQDEQQAHVVKILKNIT